MKAYNGFDENMTCRGYQYKEGETYHEDRADLCNAGFHACEIPLDCFCYYGPADSVYHEVELEDVSDETSSDSKRVGKTIKIGARLSIGKLVDASVEYVNRHVDRSKEQHVNGDNASNTGDYSAASNTGDYSAASVSGKESVAMAIGRKSKAKGALGRWITLAEWAEIDGKYHIVAVKTHRVDGKTVKPDVWYRLRNGKFVAAAK